MDSRCSSTEVVPVPGSRLKRHPAWREYTRAAANDCRVTYVPAMTDFPIRRNAMLLAGAMAMQSAALQLSAAMSSLTFALVTGVTGLVGLGPALTMIAAALTAQPAGRTMDRIGRIPVLSGGFLAGAI